MRAPLSVFVHCTGFDTNAPTESLANRTSHLLPEPPLRERSCVSLFCVVSVLWSSHPVSTEQDFLTFFRDDPWHVLGMFVCLSWIDPPSYSPLCCNYDDAARLPPFERWPLCSRVAFIMRCLPLHLCIFLSLRYTSDTGVRRK